MIFVSAGHHAIKPGASFDGFCEFDEAELWADLIVKNLGDLALRVPSGVLRDKIEYINNRDPVKSIAIEVHFNAAVDAEGKNIGRGCETLYYPGSKDGKVLAEYCNDALSLVFEPNRGIKQGWYRMNPKNGPDFFLAKTNCPAAIIEPEFIHHKQTIQENRKAACDYLSEALFIAQEALL